MRSSFSGTVTVLGEAAENKEFWCSAGTTSCVPLLQSQCSLQVSEVIAFANGLTGWEHLFFFSEALSSALAGKPESAGRNEKTSLLCGGPGPFVFPMVGFPSVLRE